MIEFRQVSKRYGGQIVLDRVDFRLLAGEVLGDGVEDAVDEAAGLAGAEELADVDRLVDDDGLRRLLLGEGKLVDAHAQHVALDAADALDVPVLDAGGDVRVDRLAVFQDARHERLRELADRSRRRRLRLRAVAQAQLTLPELAENLLLRRLGVRIQVELEEHLHRPFAGFTSCGHRGVIQIPPDSGARGPRKATPFRWRPQRRPTPCCRPWCRSVRRPARWSRRR